MEYQATRPVNLPITDFLELELSLMDTRPRVEPEAFVAELVKRWLNMENERQALAKNGPAVRGFQWKNLFLPEGTVLRTSHGDTVEFARVHGDRIMADDGTVLTPSRFANRHGKGRNAWRFVWLRFPGNDHWSRADDCRVQVAHHRNDRPVQTDTV